MKLPIVQFLTRAHIAVRLLPVLVLIISLAGCRMKIDTDPKPMLEVEAYAGEPDSGEYQSKTRTWWSLFDNPELDSLITMGLESNFALQAIEQQILQAQALYSQASSERRPEVNLSVDGSASWTDESVENRRVTSSIGANWDPDISGSLKWRARGRYYNLLAEKELLTLARVDLSVEIALAWLDMLTGHKLETLISEQEANALERLEVVEARFNQGVASRLDVLQQESLVSDIHAQIPNIQRDLYRASLRLDVLTGQLPGTSISKVSSGQIIDLPGRPTLGTPSDLLNERADLRAFKQLLVAADADAARALAERWPRLSAQLDLIWREGSDISEGILGMATALLQPLWDGGRRKAEISRTEAFKQERWFLFTNRYLEAIAEVEEAVYTEDRLRDLIIRLGRSQLILQEAEAQAVNRYEQGFTDFLPVITARQDLINIERRLVRERRNLIAMRFNLHRVLGGPLSSESLPTD